MTTTTVILSKPGVTLETADTVPQGPLGDLVYGSNSSAFEYVKFTSVATGVAAGLASIDKDGNAVSATSTLSLGGQRVGVLRSAPTTGQYCWVQRLGMALVSTPNAVSANVLLNTIATAGAIDDDATGGTKNIVGMRLATASAGGAGVTAEAYLNWPYVGATN